MPEITFEQLFFLRQGLKEHQYRGNLSYPELAIEILNFHSIKAFPSQDEQANNLRRNASQIIERFIKQETCPNNETLMLIRDFLIDHKYLDQSMIDQAFLQVRARDALSAYFFLPDSNIEKEKSGTVRAYIKIIFTKNKIFQHCLCFRLDDSGQFYFVDEIYSEYINLGFDKTESWLANSLEYFPEVSVMSRGWASITPFSTLLLIFLEPSYTYRKPKLLTHSFYTLNSSSLLQKIEMDQFKPSFQAEDKKLEKENFPLIFEYLNKNKFDNLLAKMESYFSEEHERGSLSPAQAKLFNNTRSAVASHSNYTWSPVLYSGTLQDKGSIDENSEDTQRHGFDMDIQDGQKFIEEASEANVQYVQDYIRKGGDVNYQDPKTGATALHCAIGSMALKVIDILLANPNVDFSIRDNLKLDPSLVAYKVGNDTLGEILINKKIEQEKHVKSQGISYTNNPEPY